MTLLKHCTQYTNLENSAVATGLENVNFHPIPKKGNAKECSKYWTIALISHASKVILKILQVRLQQYMNRELADVQADFRKGRGTRDQITNIHCTIGTQGNSRKISAAASSTTWKSLTMWNTKCGKFLREMGTPDHLTYLLRNCIWVKKQKLEPYMEQLIGSK